MAELIPTPVPPPIHPTPKRVKDESTNYYCALNELDTNEEKLDYVMGLVKDEVVNGTNFVSKTMIPIQNCCVYHFNGDKVAFLKAWYEKQGKPKKFSCTRFNEKCSTQRPCQFATNTVQ